MLSCALLISVCTQPDGSRLPFSERRTPKKHRTRRGRVLQVSGVLSFVDFVAYSGRFLVGFFIDGPHEGFFEFLD